MNRWKALWAAWMLAWLTGPWAHADEVQVAVAANFTVPMQKIAAAFQRDTGHKAVLAFGSTGKFYAQIKNGAQFAVFLAADDETPTRLMNEGLGVPGSQFTYAIGQLVLWSSQAGLVDNQGQVLRSMADGRIPGKLALADPKLAPYGTAAVQVMHQLGVAEALAPHWVRGESIAQAYQFAKSGNAAMGFVALSQVMVDGHMASGSAWLIPASLHDPIRQDAILLKAGQGQAAAQALMQYLRGDVARQAIRAHGYQL